jgi:hypothetical protein
MNFYNLPTYYKCNTYYFNKLLGILLYRNNYIEKKDFNLTPEIVKDNYQLILNPYLVDICDNSLECLKVTYLGKVYAKLLVFTSKYSFFAASTLAKMPLIKFANSKYAVAIFNSIYPDPLQQRTLCLPRTLFVIATSKSFKKYGTAFIGVFLPSRKMHAWVIESGCNPDSLDEIWLSYQPVVAITK